MSTNHSARDLAAELSRHAEAVCRTYLSNGKRQGHHWMRRRCRQQPWSEPLRAPDPRPDSGRALGGCGDGTVWRPAGPHPGCLRLRRPALSHGRGAPLPRPAAARAGGASRQARPGATPLGRTCAPAVPGRPADCRHPGSRLSGPPRSDRHQPRRSCAITRLASTRPRTTLPPRRGRRCWPPSAMSRARSWASTAPGSTAPGLGKAPVAEPRKSMGHQIGNGARFSGLAAGLMVAGEGLESVLSVRVALPRVPAVAGLSAHHLAVLELPPGVTAALHRPRWRCRGHPGGEHAARTGGQGRHPRGARPLSVPR